MTPEKIRLFRLEKRDRLHAVRSAKQAKWDEAQREEEEREEKKLKSTQKVLENKQLYYGRSILSLTTSIGKKEVPLLRNNEQRN